MFRWLALVSVVCVFAISFHYRRLARKGGETIARRREGAVFGAVARRVRPSAVCRDRRVSDQSRLDGVVGVFAGRWVRWIGVAIGGLAIPSAWWLFSNLGRNVSETVLTKSDHALVTTGPYRWMRHPLYATGGALLVAVGLMAANWFILGLASRGSRSDAGAGRAARGAGAHREVRRRLSPLHAAHGRNVSAAAAMMWRTLCGRRPMA